ncbi:flagellar hook-basal body complex protein FliE [Henriciella barbarensis]|jgi:flagellar hook-basal body complex protein FliE|uniref:Flagellar hook-basal body complex protein FliE n=2 Tax=Henriciella TaxID=453849 RepID=A0A399R1R2_9PROT|nr:MULTISPECIES: flagellar hook-basal body complex protein FliE [Henriciella]MCH2458363.1 flagellar hook-basal body complex protein FliE [Henriciella sp.]MCZ4297446.1 flagellar hook-basal body complex protein FliE [Henriciella marina]RIJ23692.1 flagellar hook-basal body complex protein FliE [Henriciella barbarensis]
MSGIGFSAYAALNNVKAADAAGQAAKPQGSGAVSEGFANFKQTMEAAEQTAMQTAVSGADPHAMVEALANAELALDAAVTIRDKVVEAYQELLRMPV